MSRDPWTGSLPMDSTWQKEGPFVCAPLERKQSMLALVRLNTRTIYAQRLRACVSSTKTMTKMESIQIITARFILAPEIRPFFNVFCLEETDEERQKPNAGLSLGGSKGVCRTDNYGKILAHTITTVPISHTLSHQKIKAPPPTYRPALAEPPNSEFRMTFG